MLKESRSIKSFRRLKLQEINTFYFFSDTQSYGKSKFYGSSENLEGKSLKDLFFDLECSIENKQICRDIFCDDPEKEYGKLNHYNIACMSPVIKPL